MCVLILHYPNHIIFISLVHWLLQTGVGGLTFLQFCNLNSFRTKFILAFSVFMGLSVPHYFNEYESLKGYGPVHTKARWVRKKPPIFVPVTNFGFEHLSLDMNVCAVQRHDQRALLVWAIRGWFAGPGSGPDYASQGHHDEEGQRHALVGQVPVLQDRY